MPIKLLPRRSRLLTKYYFLAREWDAISNLLDHDNETVRQARSVLSTT